MSPSSSISRPSIPQSRFSTIAINTLRQQAAISNSEDWVDLEELAHAPIRTVTRKPLQPVLADIQVCPVSGHHDCILVKHKSGVIEHKVSIRVSRTAKTPNKDVSDSQNVSRSQKDRRSSSYSEEILARMSAAQILPVRSSSLVKDKGASVAGEPSVAGESSVAENKLVLHNDDDDDDKGLEKFPEFDDDQAQQLALQNARLEAQLASVPVAETIESDYVFVF